MMFNKKAECYICRDILISPLMPNKQFLDYQLKYGIIKTDFKNFELIHNWMVNNAKQ
jgi:hypothetical protein